MGSEGKTTNRKIDKHLGSPDKEKREDRNFKIGNMTSRDPSDIKKLIRGHEESDTTEN